MVDLWTQIGHGKAEVEPRSVYLYALSFLPVLPCCLGNAGGESCGNGPWRKAHPCHPLGPGALPSPSPRATPPGSSGAGSEVKVGS